MGGQMGSTSPLPVLLPMSWILNKLHAWLPLDCTQLNTDASHHGLRVFAPLHQAHRGACLPGTFLSFRCCFTPHVQNGRRGPASVERPAGLLLSQSRSFSSLPSCSSTTSGARLRLPSPTSAAAAKMQQMANRRVSTQGMTKALPTQGLKAVAPVVRRPTTTPRATQASAAATDDIAMLEKALQLARERQAKGQASASAAPAPSNGKAAFTIKTFNAISPVGLERFPKGNYVVAGEVNQLPASPMAIMLRSHNLKVEEVAPTVRCIVRCGAGVNNIPVQKMTELGIPVFNTPGANANAVKELVVCGLLLASRGILEGNAHVNNVINKEENMDYDKIAKRIEKDKAKFVGNEIEGKTLGVVGLGAIGGRVVNAALALGMKVVGFDPVLSLDAAWKLPGDRMARANNLEDLLKVSDFITVHVPYIKGATHHMLNATNMKLCKPHVHLLNFSRGEIIDGEAVKDLYDSGKFTGKYVSDFADPFLSGHPRHLVLPHLGASTEEAEENSAAMAADTIKDFLETGTIRNSVNFPQTVLEKKPGHIGGRLCIVNKNEAGVLGQITTFLGTQKVNIEQQINTSRGEIAYTVLDFGKVEDPAGLQAGLAQNCPGIISSRFIGNVFDDELGQPGTYFYVNWAKSS